jgi:hypothetical protein
LQKEEQASTGSAGGADVWTGPADLRASRMAARSRPAMVPTTVKSLIE